MVQIIRLLIHLKYSKPIIFQDLEEKTKSLDSLEEEKKRYTDKIIAYKERMIAMKARIEEVENAEKILNKNLEEEVKQKNGNFMKLMNIYYKS